MQKKYLFIIFICSFALAYRWFITDDIKTSEPIQETLPIQKKSAHQKIEKSVSASSRKEIKPKINLQAFEKLKQQSEDPSFLPFDTDGNIYIENVTIDENWAIAHGDVLVGNAESILLLERDGLPLVLSKPKLWDGGVIPFLIDSSIPSIQKNEILKAVNIINQKTVIKFEEAKSQEDKVLFKSGGTHCYSYVGRIGGTQDLVLSPDCKAPQILHEMLHALGFYHEQSRPDRDEYLQILWENIEQKYFEQFKKVPPLHSSITESQFDYQSIMLYPSYAFSIGPTDPSILTIDGEEYSPLKTLSSGDIEKIRLLYRD